MVIFIIGAKRGQFEDDESPAVRILLEDMPEPEKNHESEKNNKSD